MNFRAKSFLVWCVSIFGEIAKRPDERSVRFLEEALELGQACGVAREKVDRLLDRVYSRPPGPVYKEIAQANLTLSMLAVVNDIDIEDVTNQEVIRCYAIPAETWHARHQAKVDAGLATAIEKS